MIQLRLFSNLITKRGLTALAAAAAALLLLIPAVSGAADGSNHADDAFTLGEVNAAIGADTLHAAGYTGSGITVAVVDTGVEPVQGLDGPDKLLIGPDLSFEAGVSDLHGRDTYGHGTVMASIIAGNDGEAGGYVGVAPGAQILSVKVADNTGAVDVSQVIAAIDWVTANKNSNGMNVRVLSLSYRTDSEQDYRIDPLADAVERAWDAGIVVVASAGNDGEDAEQLGNPALDPYIISVGAHDEDYVAEVSVFSTVGDKRHPDFVAPGARILGLGAPQSRLVQEHSSAFIDDRFLRGSGTSQAAAITAGAVALLLEQRPELTPDQVKALLILSADNVADDGSTAPVVEGEDIHEFLDPSLDDASAVALDQAHAAEQVALAQAADAQAVFDGADAILTESISQFTAAAGDKATELRFKARERYLKDVANAKEKGKIPPYGDEPDDLTRWVINAEAAAVAIDAIGAALEALADAEAALVSPQDAVESAVAALAVAEAAVVDAEDMVKTTEDGVGTAEDAVGDAEDALADAEDALASAGKELAAAEDERDDAMAEVDDAQDDVDDGKSGATEKLAEAEAALVVAEQAVTDAQTALALAGAPVATAELALSDAVEDLAAAEAAAEAAADAVDASEAAVEQSKDSLENAEDILDDAEKLVDDAEKAIDNAKKDAAYAIEMALDVRDDGEKGLDEVYKLVETATDDVADAEEELYEKKPERRAKAIEDYSKEWKLDKLHHVNLEKELGSGRLNVARAAGFRVVELEQRHETSDGSGSLDLARGTQRVTMPDGTQLSGETTFTGSSWSGSSWSGSSWSGSSWSGSSWSGSSWSGSSWSGSSWSGSSWSGSSWSGSSWSGSSWSGSSWSGSSWSGANWS